jgi:uncharacterized OsmC-like protein
MAAMPGAPEAVEMGGGTVPRLSVAPYGRAIERRDGRGAGPEDDPMLATAIDATRAKFTADPTTAWSAPAVTATLANGRARLSAGPFNWDADLPASLGGEHLAPSPTAYLLGALAGCAVAFLRDTLAPIFDVALDDVTATARCTSDSRGLLGMDGVMPDLGDLALEITVASSSPGSAVDAMLAAWTERCPIYLALLKPNAIALTTNRAE